MLTERTLRFTLVRPRRRQIETTASVPHFYALMAASAVARLAVHMFETEGQDLTLCPAEAGRFLVLPAGATVHLAIPSRCPSVPKRSRVAPCHRRSRVPHGRHIHSHRRVRKRKAERHSSPGSSRGAFWRRTC